MRNSFIARGSRHGLATRSNTRSSRDTAYQSLLRSTRQQYHYRIVETLDEHFPAIAETQPELMAQHCTGAGLTERAITEWEKAGRHTLARAAFAEAIGHFSQALEQLASLSHTRERDQLEIRLCVGLGKALMSRRGVAVREVEQMYSRAAGICETLGALPISLLDGLWMVPLMRGDREGTLRMAAILRRHGEAADDMASRVVVNTGLGCLAFWRGDYTTGKRHCEYSRRAVEGRDAVQVPLTMLQRDGLLRAHFYEGIVRPQNGIDISCAYAL